MRDVVRTLSLEFRVVHVIRGRLRLRTRRRRALTARADALEAFLGTQQGIDEIRLNPRCGSLTLRYDPSSQSPSGIVRALDGLSEGALDECESRALTGPGEEKDSWVPLALSSAAVTLGMTALKVSVVPWLLLGASIPIFRRAIQCVRRRRRLNVDVLDAAATAVLIARGQFLTGATMVWLVSLGDWIRERTMQRSRRAIEAVFDGKHQTAWVIRGGQTIGVPVSDIRVGETLVAYPGDLIAADGTITQGKASIDQKFLTGESNPETKGVDEEVYAGTVVRDGKVYYRAEKIGRDTTASKIIRLVEDAPVRDTRIQNYAEEFADRVVPYSFLGAGGYYLARGSAGGAASILIADYGTGIRVSAPTTVLSAMARAARQGILLKGGGRYLERLAEVDAIVFDKTGTLTRGVAELTEIIAYGDGESRSTVLSLAASAEERLTHPVAEAVRQAARERGLDVPARDASEFTIGLGVEADVNGRRVAVGCRRFMSLQDVSIDVARDDVDRIEAGAATPVFVAADGVLIGVMGFADPLQPEAPAVIRALRDRGIRDIVMLTGDRAAVARRVAGDLGLERFVAEALPEEKLEYVKRLQKEGRTVAVVGDGVNDSPALAQADVGIAVHGGADVACETAHVILLEGSLWKIADAIDLSKWTLQIIRQNWSLNAYPNTAAIALSLAGLIGPVGATLISNGSAVLATFNGMRPLLGANGRNHPNGRESGGVQSDDNRGGTTPAAGAPGADSARQMIALTSPRSADSTAVATRLSATF